MPQKIKQKSGAIKVSLHAAVLDDTYVFIEATARRRQTSLGEVIDSWVKYHKKRSEV